MATRIPLVIVNGQIQQLQTGDGIAVAAAQYDNRVFTNAEASTALTAGMAVYISAAGAAKRAQANAAATAKVIGIWLDATTATSSTGNCCVGGVATATTAQWDAVTGTSGGLVAGTAYYLDPANPGKLTATAPSTVGQLVTFIGIASSTTDLEFDVAQPILL
jgi:hypothetical protein